MYSAPNPAEREKALPMFSPRAKMLSQACNSCWRRQYIPESTMWMRRKPPLGISPSCTRRSIDLRSNLMKILLVEDDLVSRLLMKNILSKVGGYEIIEATNGREALDLMQRGVNPDLFVVDVMMPEVDGIEFIKRVRNESNSRKKPVVLCTSLTDRNTIVEAAKLEVRHYIVKPYSAARVLATIHEALTKRAVTVAQKWQEIMTRLAINEEQCVQLISLMSARVASTFQAIQEYAQTGAKRLVFGELSALRKGAANFEEKELIQLAILLESMVEKDQTIFPVELDKLAKHAERLQRLAERLPTMLAQSKSPA